VEKKGQFSIPINFKSIKVFCIAFVSYFYSLCIYLHRRQSRPSFQFKLMALRMGGQ